MTMMTQALPANRWAPLSLYLYFLLNLSSPFFFSSSRSRGSFPPADKKQNTTTNEKNSKKSKVLA